MDEPSSLDDLLRRCTVRIVVGQVSGTGFFVAPGQILTCAHVVEPAHTTPAPITVLWQETPYAATALEVLPKDYPDLALLNVDVVDHPCVLLDEAITIGDNLYSFGYTDEYPHGDSADFVYEGPSYDSGLLLRLSDSQARPGLSGAPLLNRRLGTVCGIVKRTRDRSTDLGARAVPTATILAALSALGPLQRQFHDEDRRWHTYLEQVRLGEDAIGDDTARGRRLGVILSGGTLVAAVLLLVVGLILWRSGWRLTSTLETGPMRGAFNVAVAAFGITDDPTVSSITSDEDGAQVAKDLVDRLESVDRDAFHLTPEDIAFRYLDTPIAGHSLSERQKTAAAIATQIKADVVIYGYIERGRRFVTEYYVSPRLEGAEEAYASPEQLGLSEHIGATPFGAPIEVRWPFTNDADRSTFTRAQLQPRFDALSTFLFGMAALKGRQYELALELFDKAGSEPDAWPDEHSSGYGKEILYLWLGTTLSAQALLRADGSALAECRVPMARTAAGSESLPEVWRCAEAAYAAALKRNPSFVRAYLGLGNLWFYQAERLANVRQTDSIHTQRCDAYMRSAAQYGTALKSLSDDADRAYIKTKARYNLGLTSTKLLHAKCTKDSKPAVEQLMAVVADYRAHLDESFYRKLGAYAQYHLGAVALLEGDEERSQGDMRAATEQYRTALTSFEDTMAIAGPFTVEDDWWQDIRWDASSQLGQASLNLSNTQRAVDAYLFVTKAYEDGIYTRDLVAGEAYYSLGVIHNQQARFRQALAFLEKVPSALVKVRRPNPIAETTALLAQIETGDAMYNLGSGERSLYRQALDQYRQVYEALDQPDIDIRGIDIAFMRVLTACRVYAALQATEAGEEAETFRAKILDNPDWQGFERTCITDLHREQPTPTPHDDR